MTMNHLTPESDNPVDRDLNWIAFQYVTNELSADDSQKFESLLAENQSAREALAQATRLMEGLHAIESMPVTVTPRIQPVAHRRVLKWTVASCSVAVMLFLAISLLPESQTPETELVSQSTLTDASEEDLEHLLSLRIPRRNPSTGWINRQHWLKAIRSIFQTGFTQPSLSRMKV